MDNHFKQKLDQHHVEWDKEGLWEELEPQLPQPKSPWRSYWWILLPLLFIPTCWGEFSQSANTTASTEETSEEVLHSISVEDQDQMVTQTVQLADSPESRKQDEVSIASGSITTASSTMVTNEALDIETPNSIDAVPNSARANAVQVPTQILTTKSNTPAKAANIATTSWTHLRPQREALVVEFIENAPFTTVVSQNETDPTTPDVILPLPSLHQPVDPPVKGMFINAHAGAGTLSRQINTNPLDPVAFEQLTRDKDRETPELALNVNLEVGFRHRSGLSIRTGLGYQQLHETFIFDEVIRTDMVVTSFDRARYFVKPSGDTLFLSGPGLATEVEARRIKHANRMTYYQIPLYLGYNIPKNRFDFELAAGVNYLLTHQYSGRTSEGELFDIVNDPTFTLKSHWGYGMRLGVNYELFGSTHLYLAAQYTKSPEFIRGEASQSYQSFGLQFGVQQRLR